MASLATELEPIVRAMSAQVTDNKISVELEDGRTIVVPTSWYPRLLYATAAERKNYEVGSVGVIWPDIDADCSIRGLLLGRKSGESPESFKFWLQQREKGKKASLRDFLKTRKKKAKK